jgi:hypothetical protein
MNQNDLSKEEKNACSGVFTFKKNAIFINGKTWITNVYIGTEDNFIYFNDADNRVLSWNGRLFYYSTFPNQQCVPCVVEFKKSYLLK